MTELSLATMFTGAVILVWGIRSLRNHKVNVFFFKLRGSHSTWIFGFVAVVSGLLMLLSGLTDFNALSAERVESFARSGLYVFGIGWALALLMEVVDRFTGHVDSQFEPADLTARRKWKQLSKPKREDEESGRIGPSQDMVQEEATLDEPDQA